MKKHPYIVTTIIATLLALVVWLLVPKEYTAITKLSDEYKEVDIAIGLDQMKAQIKNVSGGANKGINDIEIYAKLLKSKDFARTISQSKIPEKNMTYGEYLNKKDTIDAILDNINYNLSVKHQTLTISFTDRDPVVAAQMLDSVTAHLQATITDQRHQVAEAALISATAELERAKRDYQELRHKYNAFVDSHLNLRKELWIQEENALKNECTHSYNHLRNITNELAREKALMQRAYMSFAVIQSNSTPLKPNSSFFSYFFPFLIIALAGIHAYRKVKNGQLRKSFDWGNKFSPWSITILIWTTIIGLYYLLNTRLYPITEQFYYCLAIWVPVFCCCSLFTYHLSREERMEDACSYPFHLNKTIFYFFFIITLIITPLYLYRIFTVLTMFGIEDLMMNARTFAVFGEGQGLLNYANVINQSLFIVALWAWPQIPKWQVFILGFACILDSLAIMEKGSMFFVAISLIYVLFEKKIIRTRSIAIFGVVILIVFYVLNLERAGEDSDYQKEETLLDFFAMYVLSPPVAFCQLLPEIIPQFGTNTFEIVYLFLERFGVPDIVVKNKLQEFVFVPIGTNIYTVFQPFFIDFGYKGIAFFAAVYGCVSGWLYRLYKQGNSIACCLYTYAVYVLVLQYYQENVFYSMVYVLQFVFFVFLFTQQKFKIANIRQT